MTDRSAKYWSDILVAIEEIRAFVVGVDTLNAYVRDLKTKRAVERSLAIIGEAMNLLTKLDPDLKVPSARAIVGMRNRLIHSYDNVDDKIVWEVVRVDLPELEAVALKHLPTIE
ncbi:MAG: HepT-like ribonuclease domain-containing protein [Flavobacteriales bacterium]